MRLRSFQLAPRARSNPDKCRLRQSSCFDLNVYIQELIQMLLRTGNRWHNYGFKAS